MPRQLDSLTRRDAGDSRACIYCGHKADSREHIFPDWLNDLITVDGGADARQFLVIGGELVQRRSYRAKNAASQTARVVCTACNNGWMSVLEAEAKPLIGPMIVDQKRTLDYGQQLVVARWAVKTAMVAESVQYGENSFGRDERELIRGGAIPIRARVSLAAYDVSEPNATRYTRGQGVVTRSGKVFAEFYAHTIQIGHLVLSVRGTSTFDAAENRSLNEIARPRFIEIPIWPPVETCEWPPAHVLTEHEFIDYTGGNNLGSTKPGTASASFDATGLIAGHDSACRPPGQSPITEAS